MPNHLDTGIVKKALDECAADFEKGLGSHPTTPPKVGDGVVAALRDHLAKFFHKRLVVEEHPWGGDNGHGKRVARMAFYLGTIAAFRADAGNHTQVTPDLAMKALDYVKEHCKSPDIRWIYCKWS